MYLWLDLETTGLDERHDKILEVGWTLTDEQYNGLLLYQHDDTKCLGHEIYENRLVTPSLEVWDILDEELDPTVKKMHEDSGLIDDLREAEATTRSATLPELKNTHSFVLEDIEDEILEDVNRVLSAPSMTGESVILAGSGVQFDRLWIREHMPRLHDALHYRILETSTIGRYLEPWITLGEPNVKMVEHRAGNDVQMALAKVRVQTNLLDRVFSTAGQYLTDNGEGPIISTEDE